MSVFKYKEYDIHYIVDGDLQSQKERWIVQHIYAYKFILIQVFNTKKSYFKSNKN